MNRVSAKAHVAGAGASGPPAPAPRPLGRVARGALLLAALLGACSSEKARPPILLIGLDGASWPTVRELKAAGKMPTLGRLIDGGASGPCASLSWRRALSGAGHSGYWSPIIWSTIATGKLPTKHGVEDFVMPTAQYQRFWMAPPREGVAKLKLPPLPGGELRLAIRARAPEGTDKAAVSVGLGERGLGKVSFGAADSIEWVRFTSGPAWAEPTLELRCDGPGQAIGGRSMCVQISELRLFDEQGGAIRSFHPMTDPEMLESGWLWERPRERIPVASFHRRARALWQIASEQGRKVALIGWWTSWPAEDLNGTVYSALLGVHGAHATGSETGWFDKFPGLAAPESALDRARELFFPVESVNADVQKDFYEPGTCDCVGNQQDKMFRDFYWQDRYFLKLGADLLERQGQPNLMVLYLRGTDSTGHMFLHIAGNQAFLDTCHGDRCDRARLEAIVENYYRFIDAELGKLLQSASPDTIVAIVTDHGQAPGSTHGNHADNGFLILHGGPVQARVLQGAKVADVTPTLLYLAGLPVAQDMDGDVLVEALEPTFVEKNPIRFVASYETPFDLGEKAEIVDADAMTEEEERMKALGYVE